MWNHRTKKPHVKNTKLHSWSVFRSLMVSKHSCPKVWVYVAMRFATLLQCLRFQSGGISFAGSSTLRLTWVLVLSMVEDFCRLQSCFGLQKSSEVPHRPWLWKTSVPQIGAWRNATFLFLPHFPCLRLGWDCGSRVQQREVQDAGETSACNEDPVKSRD